MAHENFRLFSLEGYVNSIARDLGNGYNGCGSINTELMPGYDVLQLEPDRTDFLTNSIRYPSGNDVNLVGEIIKEEIRKGNIYAP